MSPADPHHRFAMIMAGGQGTRLWPMSRQDLPKQLLPFIQRPQDPPGAPLRSLLELAADRLTGLLPQDRQYICTGERYRQLIRERLPRFDDTHILGEPEGRDTVNAVGFGAAVFEKLDPDAVFAVLTADHIIEPDDTFRKVMDAGFRLVEADPRRLVTFSIKPTYPATGFGYVERGEAIAGEPLAHRVKQFVEKPDAVRAAQYVASRRFGWNSGMFIFHAGTFLKCLKWFKPESAAGLSQIQAAWGSNKFTSVLNEVYPTLPKISVDYAVMEPASKEPDLSICAVEMDVRWLDVGSWPSYAETLRADENGNRISGRARTFIVNGRDNVVVSGEAGEHTIALLGCEGITVVHTPDATLIVPTERAQELKDLHKLLPNGLK